MEFRDVIFTLIHLWLFVYLQPYSCQHQYASHEQQRHHHNARMLNIGHYDLMSLESKYGNELKHFELHEITAKALIDIFDDASHKNLKYFVIDTYQNAKEFYRITKPIDNVLTPRLWIVLKKFVYKLNADHHNMIHHIIFEKYDSILENDMRYLSEGNYPKSDGECSKRPLFVGYMMGDTWGNRASITNGWMRLSPKFINYFYVNSHRYARQQTGYSSPEECTNIINKYECISLPSTTCPLPISFLNGSDSIRKYGDRVYFTEASPKGVIIPQNDIHKYNAEKESDKNLISYRVSSEMEPHERKVYRIHPQHGYLVTGTNPHITNNTITMSLSVNKKGMGGGEGIKTLYGYIYRYNSEFRMKMQQYIDKFRSSTNPTFHSNQTCVFVHLRKDDRTLPNKTISIIDWCTKHTKKNEKG